MNSKILAKIIAARAAFTLMTLALTVTQSTLAGGGGSPPLPRQTQVATCVATSGNLKSAVLYTNEFGQIDSWIQFEIVPFGASFSMPIAHQHRSSLDDLAGEYHDGGVLLNDPTETLGSLTSGVFADTQLTISQTAPGRYRVQALLHVNHSQNEDVDGPTLQVNGTMSCHP